MKIHRPALWSVVNLDALAKAGFPRRSAHEYRSRVVQPQTTGRRSFRMPKRQDYVARAIDSSRELSWFLGLLERG